MLAVNVPKVRGKMAEKGFNISSFAAAVGVGRGTMTSYFNQPDKIPFYVVDKMAELLCDSPVEAVSIFFVEDLHTM